MSRIDKDKKLRPSILDRLFDDEPHNQVEKKLEHHQVLKQLRASIRRDLEFLRILFFWPSKGPLDDGVNHRFTIAHLGGF